MRATHTYRWRASNDLTEKRGEFGSRCRTSKSRVLVTSLDRSSLLIRETSAFVGAAQLIIIILYLDTLSREETLFKGVYIGTIIGYTN